MALKYDLFDGIVVFVMRGSASGDEWDRFIRFLRDAFPKMSRPRVLIITDSGPSPTQRSMLDAVLRTRANELKVAVITGSTLVRGVVQAMRVFFPAYRSFEPREIVAALTYLDVPPLRFDVVIAQANIWCGETGLSLLPRAADPHLVPPGPGGLLR